MISYRSANHKIGDRTKIREGQVANRPVYVVLGVTCDGGSDVLGLWVGDSNGEGAKYWLRVLTEVRNRGVADVWMLVCDGLKGLPEVVAQVWPETVVQQCIIHLLRNTFRYASKRHWGEIARDIKPVYTAPTERAALDAFAEFSDKWDMRYPGHHQALVRRLGRDGAVPGLRRRDPQGRMHHERHRVDQRQVAAGGQRP